MENCSLCKESFASTKEFKSHLSSHVAVSSSCLEVCTLCEKEFPSPESYKQHLMSHIENGQIEEKCSVCNEVFTPEELKLHVKSHTIDESEKCSVCGEMFNPETLKAHVRIHFVQNDTSVEKCSVCNELFPYEALKAHIKSHVTVNQKGAETHISSTQLDNSGDMQILSPSNTLTYTVVPECEKCNLCHRLFTSATDFKTHMKMHELAIAQTGPKPTVTTLAEPAQKEKCSICDSVFPTSDTYKAHLKSHNDGTGLQVWKCDTCDQMFYTKEAFKNHLHNHVSSYLQCLVCKKTFSEAKHFELHQRIHYLEKELKSKPKVPAEERPFQCSICQKSFALLKQLEAHNRIHVLEKKFFKCNVCGLKFTRPDILKSHLETHVVANFFVCKICEKTFPRADLLLQHVKTHEGLQKRHCGELVTDVESHTKHIHSQEMFICGLCGMKFIDCENLEVHMKSHAEKNIKKCCLCDKTFTSDISMNEHLLSHKKEMHGVFECQICKFVVSGLIPLKEHMQTHSDDSNDKPYVCKVCGKRYKYLNSLTFHEKTHKNEGPHFCKICQKRYQRLSDLNKHTRKIHPGTTFETKTRSRSSVPAKTEEQKKSRSEKNGNPVSRQDLSCGVCTKSFSNTGALRFHIKQEHKQDDALSKRLSSKCGFCKKSFRTQMSLHFHVKRLHKSELKEKTKSSDIKSKVSLNKEMEGVRRSARNIDQDSEVSFTCGMCEKSFQACEQLTEHMEFEHF